MCNNTQKKKAAGAGKDFTLFFGVMLHFNFKCAVKTPAKKKGNRFENRQKLCLTYAVKVSFTN